MANKKITDLPAASIPLNDTDIVEIVQGGVNKKAPKSSIFSLEQAQIDSTVAAAITALIDGAPSALNTLNKLAAAINDDAAFATTVSNALAAKQATLVSGTNIKTINSGSILGSGDIALVPKVLTANTDVTGDFNLQLGTAASHLNSLSVYSDGDINLHTETNLIVNVHDPVDNDAVGISIDPNSMVIAAGEANSTTVTINDENSSTAFSVVANDGSIVITASPGYNITLTADNIILTGNLSNFVYDEVPTGAINGVNTTYTIANTPVKGFQLFWNGMKLKEGIGFTRTGVNITMTIAPATNDTLECNYIK